MDEALLRVLVDTNVWISAFIRADGAPARVLEAFLAERFRPVASRALLEEIRDVIDRPRIRRRCRFSDDELAHILNRLSDRAIEAFPTGTLRLCRDPEDDYLLETAIGRRAEFAVTRDDDIKRDLDLIVELRRHGVEVISVAQFLELLARRST